MTDFDAQEIARYARNNAYGVSLLTIAYLREQGLSVANWARWLGRKFAGPETNWVPGMGALKMAQEAAKELLSMKADIRDLSGDDDESAVVFVWPSEEDLGDLRLSRDDIQDSWIAWEPLAESVGLRASFETNSDGVTTLTFSKAR
jgi:hypothetical protein